MKGQEDWSKRWADKWELARCREDLELDRRVAPTQQLRRLYRRLSQAPQIPFAPPGFATIIFISLIGEAFSVATTLSPLDCLPALGMCLVFSAIAGLGLDMIFLPILIVIDKALEGLCWSVDEMILTPLDSSKNRRQNILPPAGKENMANSATNNKSLLTPQHNTQKADY